MFEGRLGNGKPFVNYEIIHCKTSERVFFEDGGLKELDL